MILELKKQHIRLRNEKTFRRFLINIAYRGRSHDLFFNRLLNFLNWLLYLSRSFFFPLLLLLNDHLMFIIFLFFCLLGFFLLDCLIIILQFFLLFSHVLIYFFVIIDQNSLFSRLFLWHVLVFRILIFTFLNLLFNFSNFLFKFNSLLFIISTLLKFKLLLLIVFRFFIIIIILVVVNLLLLLLFFFAEVTYFFQGFIIFFYMLLNILLLLSSSLQLLDKIGSCVINLGLVYFVLFILFFLMILMLIHFTIIFFLNQLELVFFSLLLLLLLFHLILRNFFCLITKQDSFVFCSGVGCIGQRLINGVARVEFGHIRVRFHFLVYNLLRVQGRILLLLVAQFFHDLAISEENGAINNLLMLLLLQLNHLINFIFGHTKKNLHVLKFVLIHHLGKLLFRSWCLFILKLHIDIIFSIVVLIVCICSLLVMMVVSSDLFQVISMGILFALNDFSLWFVFLLSNQWVLFFFNGFFFWGFFWQSIHFWFSSYWFTRFHNCLPLSFLLLFLQSLQTILVLLQFFQIFLHILQNFGAKFISEVRFFNHFLNFSWFMWLRLNLWGFFHNFSLLLLLSHLIPLH